MLAWITENNSFITVGDILLLFAVLAVIASGVCLYYAVTLKNRGRKKGSKNKTSNQVKVEG